MTPSPAAATPCGAAVPAGSVPSAAMRGRAVGVLSVLAGLLALALFAGGVFALSIGVWQYGFLGLLLAAGVAALGYGLRRARR